MKPLQLKIFEVQRIKVFEVPVHFDHFLGTVDFVQYMGRGFQMRFDKVQTIGFLDNNSYSCSNESPILCARE